MMETKSVDVVLSRPGIYIMVTDVMLAFCEVDPDGACHQLRPRDFARDGELRPGGWYLAQGVTFYGPLARVSSADGCLLPAGKTKESGHG